MPWKYNPHTDEQDYYQLSDGVYLKLDQSTPETVHGGMPIFSGGINLGNSTLENVNYVLFNTSFTDGCDEGRLQWNSEDGTLEFGMPGGNVNLQVGQETLLRVKNGEVTDIPNGAVVYISDASESRPVVKLADNSNILTSYVAGVATETISTQGYITLTGLVRDVNTGGMTEGLPIWLNTSGGFTQTRPDAPAFGVLIGYVLKAHASEGIIAVRPTVIPRLEALSDTYGTPDTDGQFFAWNTVNSRFELDNTGNYLKLDQTTPQTIVTGANTDIEMDEITIDLTFLLEDLYLTAPVLKAVSHSTLPEILPFPYALGIYDRFAIFTQGGFDEPEILFALPDFSSSGSIGVNLTYGYFWVNWDFCPDEDDTYNLGTSDLRWKDINFSGTMNSSGGMIFNITNVNDTYTILTSDYTVVCNKATAFTVTLPTTVVGQIFNIKNIGLGTVTVDGNGADTIDGETSQTLGQWENLTVQCIANNTWGII